MGRHHKPSWSRKRILLTLLLVIVLIIGALTVGLAVGLTRGSGNSSSDNSTPSTTPTNNNTLPTVRWQPPVGATWNYEISGELNTSSKGTFDVWDIDLFDNDRNTISQLQSQGEKVVCYFSAGSYEDWRPDADNFHRADLGNDLSGWPGEKWLNVSSQQVRDIMLDRLDLAVNKSCNGVDPDNVDGYNNDNGLNLTQQDAIDYVLFLADAAHQRNLSIGLKNAGEIVTDVVDKMEYSVNEQCVEYSECNTFAPFVSQAKPVFHVEYPKGSSTNNFVAVSLSAKEKACDADGAQGFSTIIKNMNLDSWIQVC